MPAQDFLATYWQQSPLFMPGAINSLSPELDPQELAWLATQSDVESRLVFTDRSHGAATYRVETGPFDDEYLSSLPPRDWTLLVQDVEKHLPAFTQLLEHVGFVPDWRIDDLMISFAAPGGSVGPHQDNYDVFLCQGSGTREWRLAAPGAIAASGSCEELALLQPFTDPAPLNTAFGDVLYLPPGVPHWGVAEEACMTYSIGMRAPTSDELRLCFDRELPDIDNPFPATADDNQAFYTDPDLCDLESAPGQISAFAVDRCRKIVRDGADVSARSLAITLGCAATDLKAWLAPECPSTKEVREYLHNFSDHSSTPVHGMSKIAWWTSDSELIVFANGACVPAALDELATIQAICRSRRMEIGPSEELVENDLLHWLLNVGTFDLFANDELVSTAK